MAEKKTPTTRAEVKSNPKTQRKRAVKKDPEKVTDSELQRLQTLQQQIGQALQAIASAEIAKQEVLLQHADLKEEMQEFTQSLQDKYGIVNINLADGKIQKIPQQPQPKMEPVK